MPGSNGRPPAAQALVLAFRDRCPERGATTLIWQTARDNLRAAVYERLGAVGEEWLDYSLRSKGRLTRAPVRA